MTMDIIETPSGNQDTALVQQEVDAMAAPVISTERSDLLESLAKHRYFLRYTVRGLTDEQAAHPDHRQ